MHSKTTMTAPEGVTESVIEGTYYWPDETDGPTFGQIETTNPLHVEMLKRHGYTVAKEESIQRPAHQLGLIDIDELGRTGLLEALKMRGLSFPTDATREVLVEQAHGWNRARRGRPGSAAAAPAPAPAPAPAAPAPARDATAVPFRAPEPQVAPPAPEDAVLDEEEDVGAPPKPGILKPDFSEYPREDLIAWLTSRGVAFKTTASKATLAKLATEKHDEIIAAKKPAA